MFTTHPQPTVRLEASRYSRRSDAFLAALPHLLMSSAFFGVSVAFGGRGMPWYPFFLVVVLVVALLYAWRREWPLWSGSWAGYGLLLIAVPLFMVLMRTGANGDRFFILVLMVGCILIALRYPLHAVLTSLPLLVFLPRLFAFEQLSGGNLVWGAIFVLLAIISAMIVCNRGRRAVIAVILFHLLAGAAITLGNFFLPYNLGPFSAGMQAAPRTTPLLWELFADFAPVTLSAIVASLALLIVRPAMRRFNYRHAP